MSLTPAQRAILRQVVIGSPDLDATTRELRESLGVARGFADPLLEEIGMADETIRVGPEAHLEVVAPLRGDVSLAAWLRKAGGGGGYALSIQVPDLTPHLAAAARQGVRVVADLVAYGHRIVQLHPGDMGLLIELDEIADPAAWFWDDIEAEVATAPRVDDVLAVEITSHDPRAQVALWASVLGAEVDPTDSEPRINLGRREIRFVEGSRKMLSAIDLAAVDPEAHAGTAVDVAGVHLRLVDPAAATVTAAAATAQPAQLGSA
ncbi:hypothetical protein FHX52_3539 [Humibacillus xanthopallidus]|uniref:Glyoxalase-like protein n=1 Tax=Humibacillus xanthopallidus TaxID=412689 RepID=A0A543PRW1_9MICO|nr:hypothetical protein [Humibacillus xanthopallidus]TQN46809.1 hypothetical protein FHX52_3539 [Humibacillus xanthopallidus]